MSRRRQTSRGFLNKRLREAVWQEREAVKMREVNCPISRWANRLFVPPPPWPERSENLHPQRLGSGALWDNLTKTSIWLFGKLLRLSQNIITLKIRFLRIWNGKLRLPLHTNSRKCVVKKGLIFRPKYTLKNICMRRFFSVVLQSVLVVPKHISTAAVRRDKPRKTSINNKITLLNPRGT